MVWSFPYRQLSGQRGVSAILSWQPLCCGSAQLLGNVFTVFLLWSLMLCHPRVLLWGSWATCSFFHLDIIWHSRPCLSASLQLSLWVADMEHFYYGWCWGSCCSDIVMFQVLTKEFLKYCCSNSRCYLLPGLLTLIAKNLSPAVRKLAEENLCTHLSCFSANSASMCKSSSRIYTKVLNIEKLMCACHVLGFFGRENQKRH